MSRAYQILGWGYAAACTAVAVAFAPQSQQPAITAAPLVIPAAAAPSVAVDPVAAPVTPATEGAEWFRRIKPSCNSLEVASAVASSPAPAGATGSGYHAACLALAGKLDEARAVIDLLDAEGARIAASIVFEIGHPVADAGDDKSAGPIMQLVVQYLPDHYMALYHAGVAQYMVGQHEDARRNIESFLRIYRQEDGWRSNGLNILNKLDDSTGTERRRPAEPGQ